MMDGNIFIWKHGMEQIFFIGLYNLINSLLWESELVFQLHMYFSKRRDHLTIRTIYFQINSNEIEN